MLWGPEGGGEDGEEEGNDIAFKGQEGRGVEEEGEC